MVITVLVAETHHVEHKEVGGTQFDREYLEGDPVLIRTKEEHPIWIARRLAGWIDRLRAALDDVPSSVC
jgi:hypothetical protein